MAIEITDSKTPLRLGPYELQRSLGAGGMGEVFLALDSRLRREVAVKILPPEVSRDPARAGRFEREARLTSQLNHPNIVSVYDVVHEGGVHGLVMELVRGETLREVLGRGAITPRRAVAIAVSIAEALAAAHGVGVIHRDLKPENVMLTREGTVKVLDFGLAREAAPLSTTSESETAVHLSKPGQVMGTAIYMSPEQASGEAVDFRTDQFSLGLVLYEMLAGRHPFRRGTVTSTVAAIIVDEPAPSVDQLSPEIPASLARVLRRCLRKEPRERYGSTADLAHDLAEAVEELERPSASVAASPFVRARGAGWLPWGIALLALILAAGSFLMRPARDAERERASIETVIDLADLVFPTNEVTRNLALSPDGRYLLLAARDGSGMLPLRLQDLRTGELRTIDSTRNAIGFAWSPDSRAIAYLEGGKLKRVGLDGTPPVVICDARPEGMPTWEGDTILFPQFSPPAGIFRVSASGGTPVQILKSDLSPGSTAAMWPSFLPDGRHFLYLLMDFQGDTFRHRLMVGSIEAGESHEIGPISSTAHYADGHLLYVRDGALLAQPFDLERLRLHGEARPIARDVNYFYNTGGASFSASATGLVAWRVQRTPSPMLWVNRSGATIGTVDPQVFDAPRISRDGRRFAASVVHPQQGTSDVWIYSTATGAVEKLTFDSRDEKESVWAPDGGGLYFRSDGKGPPDVAYRAIGDSETKFLIIRPGVQEPRDISPDGRLLIFQEMHPDTGPDLWITPADGRGEARPLIRTPFADSDARFSPDGRWIAYQSDVSGRPEIYIRALAEGSRPSMVSSGGGTMPRWSVGTGELFYYSRGMITAARVGNDGTVNPADSKALFHVDIRAFDVTPDGESFLTVPTEDTRVPVRILSGWTARLADPQLTR